nr:ABC transporter ATP-binding protein [Candidatus Sigynarchaeota archaeon]
MANGEVLIRLENVDVVLTGNVILHHINIEIKRGEYVGLIGRNGSGKTTLMKTILGIIPTNKGRVEMFGGPIRPEALERIGYVPQLKSIEHEFPATVRDVVAMGMYIKKNGNKAHVMDIQEKNQLALHKVQMEGYLNRPIGHLSGGEQQKVLLAQALVRDPDILLLDEPTSALDFVMVRGFLSLLTTLNKAYNLTLLVIQHNLEILRPFCSRLLMLKKTILYDGEPTLQRADDLINDVFFR